jgi:hypothetical protein
MPDGARTDKIASTEADRRRRRLADELRSNLLKRKQQARGRTTAAKSVDQRGDGRPDR